MTTLNNISYERIYFGCKTVDSVLKNDVIPGSLVKYDTSNNSKTPGAVCVQHCQGNLTLKVRKATLRHLREQYGKVSLKVKKTIFMDLRQRY
jgi:hypothetical protein